MLSLTHLGERTRARAGLLPSAKSAIQSFVKTLKEVEGFPKKIQDGLKQAFETALSQLKSNGNRPIVMNDMSDVPDLLKEVKEFLEQHKFDENFIYELERKFAPLIDSVKKGVDESLEKAVYELDDPVLAALSKTTILERLTTDEENFLREEKKTCVHDLVDSLPDKERKVIYYRYNFACDQHVPTLRELSFALGVSAETIRQMEMRAVRKIRDAVSVKINNLEIA